MNEVWLNINQRPQELDDLYGEKDYYWYLRSVPFGTFLSEIGRIVNQSYLSVLDIACGEGQLQRYIDNSTRYHGFDGSVTAISKAKEWMERALKGNASFRHTFSTGRIESYSDGSQYDMIVFGGVLSVLIKPEYRLDFIQSYLKTFNSKGFIIYDLTTLDTGPIDKRFELASTFIDTIELHGLQEIKKTRVVRSYLL